MKMPMRGALPVLVILFPLFAAAAGERISTEVTVEPFDRVEVGGAVRLAIVQGDTPFLRVSAPEEVMPRTRIEQADGTLTLGCKGDPWGWFNWGGDNCDVLFEVRTPALKGLSIRGSSEVALGDMQSGDLRLEVGGAAHFMADRMHFANFDADIAGAADVSIAALEAREMNMTLSGSCDASIAELKVDTLAVNASGASHFETSKPGRAQWVRVEVDGASSYKGRSVAAAHVEVNASGASRAEVHASESLKARSHGASDIEYGGEPSQMEIH